MTSNKKLTQRALLNDFAIALCFWSLIILPLSLLILQNFEISHPLAVIFFKSSILVSISLFLFCFPFSLRKIKIALDLAEIGIEVLAEIESIEPFLYGSKIKFKFEYDGHAHHKEKFFQFALLSLPKNGKMKLLIDPRDPSKFIILELKRMSIFSNSKNMNKF